MEKADRRTELLFAMKSELAERSVAKDEVYQTESDNELEEDYGAEDDFQDGESQSDMETGQVEEDQQDVDGDDKDDADEMSVEKPSKAKRKRGKQVRKLHPCDTCGKSFPRLDRHQCKEIIQLCSLCGESFPGQAGLNIHLNQVHHLPGIHSKPRGKMCSECGKVVSCLRVHMKSHTGQRDFACHICGKMFIQRSNRNTHIRKIHNMLRSYVCSVCDAVFSTEGQLANHCAKDHGDANISAKEQGFTATDDSITSSNANVSCLLCSAKFKQMIRYLYHLKSHMTETTKWDEAKKQEAEDLLKEHEIYLTKAKTITCDKCPAIFFYKADWIAHQKAHNSSGVMYKCAFCEKTFFSKTSRFDHQLTHTEHYPYVCQVCGKPFQQERRYQVHIIKEHPDSGLGSDICIPQPGQKTCEDCGKTFSSSYNLVVHMRTHSGAQPYQCPICHRTFADPSNLIHHGRRAHPECPSTCFKRSGPLSTTTMNDTI